MYLYVIKPQIKFVINTRTYINGREFFSNPLLMSTLLWQNFFTWHTSNFLDGSTQQYVFEMNAVLDNRPIAKVAFMHPLKKQVRKIHRYIIPNNIPLSRQYVTTKVLFTPSFLNRAVVVIFSLKLKFFASNVTWFGE